MRYSYSNINTFANCPYQWYLKYKKHLKTIPKTNADNALWLGLGVHKGIECGVESGIAEYKSHFNLTTDANINWIMQLEYQIPKVIELLPQGGEHELEVKTDDFVGYIDYVCGDTLYDFKFSNNIDGYLTSPQLSIYKYYLEKVRPDIKINHLKFVFIPKVNIRQKLKSKPPETLQEFRNRLQEHLEATEIKIIEVPYNENSITQFQQCCQRLKTVKKFPKNQTKLCDWCDYKAYCQSNGKVDWMITNDIKEDVELVSLPQNKRREVATPTKKVIWLYGKPFTGKTTFADKAPDPLMLNTDGNAQYATAPFVSIQDEITVTGRITKRKLAWEVLKEYIDELEKKDNTFKTIVLDLLSDSYEMCRQYMFKELNITHESDDTYRAWDKVETEFMTQIKRLVNLPYENIILLSHEDATKDLTKKSGEKFSSMKPKMRDKIADNVAGMVGIAGRTFVDNGKYLLEIESDEVKFGGGRLGVSNVIVPLEWDEVAKLFEVKKSKGDK